MAFEVQTNGVTQSHNASFIAKILQLRPLLGPTVSHFEMVEGKWVQLQRPIWKKMRDNVLKLSNGKGRYALRIKAQFKRTILFDQAFCNMYQFSFGHCHSMSYLQLRKKILHVAGLDF